MIYFFLLTNVKHRSEHAGIVNGRAVPPPVLELPLALVYPDAGAPCHVGHVVLVQVAQFGLAARQPTEAAAQGLGAQEIGLGVAQHVDALKA